MAFNVHSSVPLAPIDVDVLPNDFDIQAITTTDLIIAGIAIVTGVILAYLAKRALRRVLSGNKQGITIAFPQRVLWSQPTTS